MVPLELKRMTMTLLCQDAYSRGTSLEILTLWYVQLLRVHRKWRIANKLCCLFSIPHDVPFCFSNLSQQGLSYAINVAQGGSLEIHDSCFLDNDFVGPGAVILQQEEDLVSSSGNYGTFDAGLNCQFISINGVCKDYESESCGVDPTMLSSDSGSKQVGTPTPAPAPAPVSSSAERRVAAIWLCGVTALLALLL